MNWEINLHPAVESWLLKPAESGPTLGRPLVDRIHGSRLHNLKELRPASAGRTDVRILFVFDPEREAILLVAGDKAGRWSQWYAEAIPFAEARQAGGADRDRGEGGGGGGKSPLRQAGSPRTVAP
jgi:hypothetical protein